jgi:hypothetical protein
VRAAGAGAVATLVLLCLAGRARAGEPSPADLARAEGLFREAIQHVGRNQYERALPLLEEGYRLSRLPGFLFNLGQVHRLRGDCAEAVLHYRAFLGARIAASERADAEYHIAALEPCPALAATPAPAPAPAPASIASPAAPDATERKPAGLEVPAAAASRRLPAHRIASLAAFAGAVLATAGGLYYGLQARADRGRVEAFYRDARSSPRAWDSDIAAVEARGQRASARAALLGAAAGGLLLSGAALTVIVWREQAGTSARLAFATRF